MKQPINEKISTLRKEKGMTQEQLGAKLGVSGQAVSKWEKGETMPDIMLLPDLCSLLGVSADKLLEIPEEEKGEKVFVKVESGGLTFALRGISYQEECLKLKYEKVVRFLRVLTSEINYKVLQNIPISSGITDIELKAATGLSEEELNTALRTLVKWDMIEEYENGDEAYGEELSFEGKALYTQNTAGMIGVYMVLAGCMGRCQENDEDVVTSITETKRSKTADGNTEIIKKIITSEI